MKFAQEQISLRVYLRNTDHCGWSTTTEMLVEQARHDGIAGATVVRGRLGMDSSGRLLETRALSFLDHVPVMVELVDDVEVIREFLPTVDRIAPNNLVTLGLVQAHIYRRSEKRLLSGCGLERSGDESQRLPDKGLSDELPTTRFGRIGHFFRIFIAADAVYDGEPLYRAIIHQAQECESDWAAVVQGAMGYQGDDPIRGGAFFHRRRDLPMIVEVVHDGATDKILSFLNLAVSEGTVAVEDVWLWKNDGYLART